jgi:hypothetical protein
MKTSFKPFAGKWSIVEMEAWGQEYIDLEVPEHFTLNQKRLREQEQKMEHLCRTVGLLEHTVAHQAIGLDEAKGLLQVITDYAYALTTLDRFDQDKDTIVKADIPNG